MIYTKILSAASFKTWQTVTAESDSSPNYSLPVSLGIL